MAKRGFHQTGEVFAREIIANPNPVAINAPEGFLLEGWNIFYEILSSSFSEVALLAAESFDKVEQTVENIVPNINPENSTYAPNHIVPKRKPLVRGDKLIKHYVVGTYEPFNGVYMVNRRGVIYLSERESPSNFGYNRSLQQASHQGWPSVDLLPNVAVQTLDKLKLPASSGDFFRMVTRADLSGKDAGMLGDTNKRTLENLPGNQQIIAPIGGIMKSSGKRPAVQEQINQLRLQSSNKSGRTRKTPLSSLASKCTNSKEQVLRTTSCPQHNAGTLGDTNKRTLENLTVDQQIIAPIGGVQQMKSGKQAAVQEQMNQLRLHSSKKSYS